MLHYRLLNAVNKELLKVNPVDVCIFTRSLYFDKCVYQAASLRNHVGMGLGLTLHFPV